MKPRARPKEIQQRLPRFSMPSGMAQVHARLELVALGSVDPLVGRLWDVSHKGGCIALHGHRQIVVPAGSRLQVRDPMSHAAHLLEAELRWCTPLSHSTFVGMLFTGGPSPAETFLAAYMRSSWTEEIPVSRLSWPLTRLLIASPLTASFLVWGVGTTDWLAGSRAHMGSALRFDPDS